MLAAFIRLVDTLLVEALSDFAVAGALKLHSLLETHRNSSDRQFKVSVLPFTKWSWACQSVICNSALEKMISNARTRSRVHARACVCVCASVPYLLLREPH